MLDIVSMLPSNDMIEDYREEELDLQLQVIDCIWIPSMEGRLARLDQPSEILAPTTKKAVIDGKRVDVPYYEKISAIGVSRQWSIESSEKKSAETGFVQSNPSVRERLNQYRYYPYTEQFTNEFSAMLRTKRDSKNRLTKYALVDNDPVLLKWFNLVCRLRAMQGQTEHFFGNGRRAFLRDTRATFMAMRAHWETPREEARVTNRAQNNLGIGAEARAKAIAKLGDVNTVSLIAQINESKDLDPEKRIELMERVLQFEQGKAAIASEYAAIAKENTEIVKELRAPVTEKFRESMREGEQFAREDLLRGIEVQRKLKEATNE